MDPGAPPWKACVLTVARSPDDYNDLRNAILYADSVSWISGELLAASLLACLHIVETDPDHSFSARSDDERFNLIMAGIDAAGFGHLEAHYRFLDELRAAGLESHVKQLMTVPDMSKCVPRHDEGHEPRLTTLLRNADNLATTAMEGCRFVVDQRRRPDLPNGWNAYFAATFLMKASSRLLLPDVSSLPLDAIVELRDRLQDTLDPMRAEMLRFTEDLRKLVGEKTLDGAVLAAEAENLVATRVEPVVREARSRTHQLAEKKWRKLYTSAAKAFGFAGAALVDPKLIAKAIQQTLEVGALTISDPEDEPRDPRATAQFVLEARSVMTNLLPAARKTIDKPVRRRAVSRGQDNSA